MARMDGCEQKRADASCVPLYNECGHVKWDHARAVPISRSISRKEPVVKRPKTGKSQRRESGLDCLFTLAGLHQWRSHRG